jgi:oligoribonuclease (3'-5' exoribonuclease)
LDWENRVKGKRDLVARARAEANKTVASGKVELVGRETVLEYVKDLKGVLAQGSIAERRAFLSSFVQRAKSTRPG